jgi:hypothetical protein
MDVPCGIDTHYAFFLIFLGACRWDGGGSVCVKAKV